MTEAGFTALRQQDESQRSAGEQLRVERERQGLSIEVLSSIIKVVPAKIQALEAGDLTTLGDANFTRALAQTVCRTLRMDPSPVMAALPPAQPARLHDEHAPLNQPLPQPGATALFSVRGVGSGVSDLLKRKWFWPLCILLAAVLVWWWPEAWEGPAAWWTSDSTVTSSSPVQTIVVPPAPAVTAAITPTASALPQNVQAPLAASEPVVSTVVQPVAPVVVQMAETVAEAGSLSEVSVRLEATQPSWVELTETQGGRKLFSRLMAAGETVDLMGAPPIEAIIGNAEGVRVIVAGQVTDLAPHVRNNVARLTLPRSE